MRKATVALETFGVVWAMMPVVLAIKDRVKAARPVNFHESLVIRVSPSDDILSREAFRSVGTV
jgi:hypothetical protein